LTFGQEGVWYSVPEYFDKNADATAKSKLRSIAQKRAYLEKKGMKIQKDRLQVETVLGISFRKANSVHVECVVGLRPKI